MFTKLFWFSLSISSSLVHLLSFYVFTFEMPSKSLSPPPSPFSSSILLFLLLTLITVYSHVHHSPIPSPSSLFLSLESSYSSFRMDLNRLPDELIQEIDSFLPFEDSFNLQVRNEQINYCICLNLFFYVVHCKGYLVIELSGK